MYIRSRLRYIWFYILFSLCCVLSAATWYLCCYICVSIFFFTSSQKTSKRHMLQKKNRRRMVEVGKYAKEIYEWHLQHATTQSLFSCTNSLIIGLVLVF